ncbi:hypothetical protein MHHB_P0504 [Methanofervidicoccus abyssi]|uniref:Uncharacterized protein n=1 Tax=Methanofervidicoccus abyssi TaxID=2082189 RepID=A0A401HPT3_9EURY|nr:hypothetical protein MHHB_P0504 [Methanofervidicoccus abyssi]
MVTSTGNVVVTLAVPSLAIVMFISVGVLLYIGVVVVIFSITRFGVGTVTVMVVV